ncbi:hypothetical protein AVEN_226803-1 [Araneus ventricosus]|uniref:Uncharacterized protein n=1 Tax=Araneus ventricosus TaxID=182803 RepID=A0A4Y2M3F2_ARAVE|nr:hypothetical protein AVEN_226803-1 [Araneus ventricosus]
MSVNSRTSEKASRRTEISVHPREYPAEDLRIRFRGDLLVRPGDDVENDRELQDALPSGRLWNDLRGHLPGGTHRIPLLLRQSEHQLPRTFPQVFTRKLEGI